MRALKQSIIGVWMILFLISCSNTTKLTHTHLDEAHVGKPVKDVLVIAVLNDPQIRKIFETYFVKRLEAIGVEAIASSSVLPIDADAKHEKEAILKIVDKYGNDAIIVTRLGGFSEKEISSRGGRLQGLPYFYNYYQFYNAAWDAAYGSYVYGEHEKIILETRLYDAKTESIIWAGESQTRDPKTTGQEIGQVVDVVMKALQKNGLLHESK
jgi:hypothetical protein